MTPDSPFASGLVLSRGYLEDRYDARRQYGATVTHVTGRGPLRRLTEERFARWRRRHLPESTPISLGLCAAHIYASVMDAGPHYVVGPEGDSYQTCPEHLAAWHVGRKGSSIYARTDWPDERTDWWLDRWEPFGYGSPLDLADGDLWGVKAPYSANEGSIGIELAWPYDASGTPPTDAQWRSWARLVRDIHQRREIPLEPTHVVGHSDAHPRSRTRRSDPWDPPPWFNPSAVCYWLGITTGPPQ